MSILYTKIQRVNPRDPEGSRKWYIAPKRVKQKTEKEIAESLTNNTTLNRGEALMAVNELQPAIIKELLDGYTVQLGDWGSFQLTFSCTGADTEEECTVDLVTAVNIRFRAGKLMKQALKDATFVAR